MLFYTVFVIPQHVGMCHSALPCLCITFDLHRRTYSTVPSNTFGGHSFLLTGAFTATPVHHTTLPCVGALLAWHSIAIPFPAVFTLFATPTTNHLAQPHPRSGASLLRLTELSAPITPIPVCPIQMRSHIPYLQVLRITASHPDAYSTTTTMHSHTPTWLCPPPTSHANTQEGVKEEGERGEQSGQRGEEGRPNRREATCLVSSSTYSTHPGSPAGRPHDPPLVVSDENGGDDVVMIVLTPTDAPPHLYQNSHPPTANPH